MKRIALVLILLMLVPTAFAGKISTELAEITVPDAWQTQMLDGGMFVAINPEVQSGVRVNVNLVQETLPGEYNAAQYKEAAVQGLKAFLPDIKILKSEDNWHVVEYEYSGFMLRQLQYFYVEGSKGLVLTFTAAKDAFDAQEKSFRDMEKGFKLK